jgi:hypothetical protein
MAREFAAAGTTDKKPMRLVDVQTIGGGVAVLTYQRARPSGR